MVIQNSNKFTASSTVLGESVTSVTLNPDINASNAKTNAREIYQMTPSDATGSNGFDAKNYEINYLPYHGLVSSIPLTITATGPNKVYGSILVTTTNDTQFTSSGLVNGETISGVTLTPSIEATYSTSAAGTNYNITPSLPIGENGFNATNYNITYLPFNGFVTKKSLIATADNQTKIYGQSNPEYTISYDGFVNNEDASVLTLAPSPISDATDNSDVGKYDINLTNGTADNYSIIVNKGLLTINKATLMVAAENKSKVYGTANPSLTIKYEGFKGLDNETSLTTAPKAVTSAFTNSAVGTYSVTVDGGTSTNYDIIYTEGKLEVTKAILTITAQDASRCFASTDPSLTYKVTGYLYGDDATVITTVPTVKTNAVNSSIAGDYKTIASGAASTNYDFVYVDGKYTINPLPAGAVTSSVDYVCDGATLTLNITGGATYVWYKGGTAIAGATGASVAINDKGIYNAKLISSFGCEAMSSNTLTIKQYYAPVADFINLYSCINLPVLITNKSTFAASGSVKYLWEDGAGSTSSLTSPSFTYSTTGAKTIKLSVIPDYCPALKQSVSKVITIEAPIAPVRLPVVDAIIYTQTPLQARNFGATYDWKIISSGAAVLNSTNISNPVLTTNAEVLFNIKISAQNGCVTVDTLQVRVFKEKYVYLPNAFTPNGDGVNDEFKINPVGINSLNYFRIFNQWGQIVFETSSLSEGWDGKLNGVRQPLATYNWILEASDIYGNKIRESGSVTLIR